MRQRHIGSLALAALCCALGALGRGGASVGAARATIQPPVGTPDLSQMALRPTDLPAGAIVKHQGYIHEEGYIAAYQREFGPTRVGHARVIALDSEMALDQTVDDASLTFSALQLVIRQKSALAKLARETLKALRRHASARVRKIPVRKPHTLHVGDGTVVLPMTLYTSLGRVQAAIAFGVRDRWRLS